MKRLLTFEEFVNENYSVNEKKIISPWLDAMPFKPTTKTTAVNLFDEEGETKITYYDRSRSLPKGRLGSKENYQYYLDHKLYMFKPLEQVWPELKKLGLKLPPKAPMRGGFFEFDENPIKITVYNQIGGRGAERYMDNQLDFIIPKDDMHDSTVKAVGNFIKDNCFFPSNTPVPTQQELMESEILDFDEN